MKSPYFWLVLPLIPAAFIAQTATPPADPLTFRIIFGASDAVPTRWDGEIAVSGSRATKIEPWRTDENDRIDGTRGWRLGTVASPPGAAQRLGKVAPKGVILTVEGAGEQTRFDVTTPHGKFSFSPASVTFVSNYRALDGRARMERVPNV
jgi:hypothetical protein